MYKFVAVAVVSLWSALALGEELLVIADTTQGILRLDKTSLLKEGKYTKALLVYHFKQQQRFSSPPKDVFDDRKDEVLIDCANPSMAMIANRFFEGEKLVKTFVRKESDIKFQPSTPDTMVETVVKMVCATKPNSALTD